MGKSKKDTAANYIPTPQELTEFIKQCRTEYVESHFKEMSNLLADGNAINAQYIQRLMKLRHLPYRPMLWPFNVPAVVSEHITKEECASIINNTHGGSGNTAICLSGDTASRSQATFDMLLSKSQRLGDRRHEIGKVITKFSFTGLEKYPKRLFVRENDFFAGIICLGGDRAFLAFEFTPGKVSYVELEEFCALSAVYDSRLPLSKDEDNATGIFTCFNRLLGIAITEIIPNLKDAKLPITDGTIDSVEINEPRRELLDGCYHYLKRKTEPVTQGQRHFVANYRPKQMTAKEMYDKITLIQEREAMEQG